MKRKNEHSLKWRMIRLLLTCWLVPFTVMFAVLVFYVASNHSDMIARNFQKQLEFNDRICVERLNLIVEASREASYDGELLTLKEAAERGNMGELAVKRACKEYLRSEYQKNAGISSVFFWFHDEGTDEMYHVYNEQANGSYQQQRVFKEQDLERITACAAELKTKIRFEIIEDRFYLIRNLVDGRFHEQGVLVFLLNQDYCFDSIANYPSGDGSCVKVNDGYLDFGCSEMLREWGKKRNGKNFMWDGNRLFVADAKDGDSYTLETHMALKKEVIPFPFFGYQYVCGGMLLSLIPLLWLMMRVFRKEVTEPVQTLCEGARNIEQGELGYQIGKLCVNSEFDYLTETFNHMSSHLKEQFDRIYEEEIALREARIMALQSHINPHFMNNTLEIINWEARLSGNMKVSRMIEALSTMMDAAMDRRKRPEIRLEEEMGYINSYLYITGERLGKRLTVKVDIPDELKNCQVPRLILQPVVENAVEHGVAMHGSGTVEIRGHRDEKYLYLEVENDGGLEPEDKEKIARLLSDDNAGKSEMGNIGIANVHQRIVILHGKPCGLTIEESGEKKVCARLTLLYKT